MIAPVVSVNMSYGIGAPISALLSRRRRTSRRRPRVQPQPEEHVDQARHHPYRAPMVRVVLVCGSLQRASANRGALDVARAVMAASGVEVGAFESLGSIPPLNPDRGDDPGEAVLSLRAQLLASSLVASVAQRPSHRFAAVRKLARDAGVELGPLADHIATQDEAWLASRSP
jgi:hypothetical protein